MYFSGIGSKSKVISGFSVFFCYCCLASYLHRPIHDSLEIARTTQFLSYEDVTDSGHSAILPPRQSTESDKTNTYAVDSSFKRRLGDRPVFCSTFEWTLPRWLTLFGDIVILWPSNLVPTGFFVVSAAIFPALTLEFTSDCLTWEVDAAFSFESLGTGFPVLVRSKFWTLCFECSRAVRCTRTQRCWRPVDNLRYQIPHWSFILQPSVHLFVVIFPVSAFQKRSERSGWAEMATWKLWDVYAVKQTEKVVPLITGETASRQDIGKLIFGVTYLIWIVGSKSMLSNNQSDATLWVRDTLIVGLLPFLRKRKAKRTSEKVFRFW